MRTVTDHVRIVLVRTGKPGNVGGVARAMRNMGLHDLWLVEPRCDHLSHESKRQSTRGESILHDAHVVASLPEALTDVTFTVATSCRGGLYREQIELSPRQAAERIVHHARTARAALLFGPEDCGLQSEELLDCDALVRIPSCDDYPSLNLAQAMMICAYEIFVAASASPAERSDEAAADERADGRLMHELGDRLRAALLRIGYLRPEHPEHLLFAIRAILGRAGLSRREAQILIGLTQQIESFAAAHDALE